MKDGIYLIHGWISKQSRYIGSWRQFVDQGNGVNRCSSSDTVHVQGPWCTGTKPEEGLYKLNKSLQSFTLTHSDWKELELSFKVCVQRYMINHMQRPLGAFAWNTCLCLNVWVWSRRGFCSSLSFWVQIGVDTWGRKSLNPLTTSTDLFKVSCPFLQYLIRQKTQPWPRWTPLITRPHQDVMQRCIWFISICIPCHYCLTCLKR